MIIQTRCSRVVHFGLMALMFACCFAQPGAVLGQAQSTPPDSSAALPTFAVATVKPAKSDEVGYAWRNTPDGISFTGMPMQQILCAAFNLEDDRVIGLPAWIKNQRFDIEAKVDPADAPKLKDLNYHQRYGMIVPVLADRFSLKFHHESRVLPVYVLIIAKGGSKLTETKPGPDGKVKGGGWSMGNGHMDATSTPMSR